MKLLQNIINVLKNFYVVSGIVFVFAMVFYADANVNIHYQQLRKIDVLKEEKLLYLLLIEKASEEKDKMTQEGFAEKFAREKFLMRESGEDLYIVVEK